MSSANRFETKVLQLIRDLGFVEYFGKEALYQYGDKKHVYEWLQSINNVANGIKTRQIGLSAKEKEDLLRQLAAYMEVAEKMGQIAIQKKNVRVEETELTAESTEIGRVLEALRYSVSNEISREISDSFRNNRNFLIMIFVFTLLLAVGIGFFIYQTISIPILRLKDAAEEIGKGNLDKRVDIKSKDEIGVLASSFNQMVGNLQEATVSRDRSYEQAEKRSRELSVLYSVSAVVHQSLDLAVVLRSVMRKVLEIFDFDAGRIYMLDEDRIELHLLAHEGFP